MKRIVLTAIIAAFAITALNAQEITERKAANPALSEKQKKHSAKDFSELNLSAGQKEKIAALQEEQQLQTEELKKNGAPQEKIDALNKDYHEQLLAVLTDEQQAQWKKIQETRHTQRARENEMLTGQRKAKLAAINSDAAEKIKAIEQDETLTAEQKKEKTKELILSLKNDAEKKSSKGESLRKHELKKEEQKKTEN